MQIEIHQIHLSRREAVTSDGQIIPIVSLLDNWGEDTEEPSEAKAFVAGPDNRGQWHTDMTESYVPATSN